MSSREKIRVQCIFSLIPMSKRAAARCAWLFPVSLWRVGSGQDGSHRRLL